MKLLVELPPDVEHNLEEKARNTGQSLEEFAAAFLAHLSRLGNSDTVANQTAIAARLAALEKIGSFDNRVRAGLPPLSDEAISREDVYEGRGA